MRSAFVRNFILCQWMLIIPFFAFAQKFHKLYNASAGYQVFDGRQTSDGGYVMTGIMIDSLNNASVAISKLDCQGDVLWTKTFSPSSTVNNVNSKVIELASGGYVLMSNLGGFGGYDIFVAKLDINGTVVWKTRLSGSGENVGNGLTETFDGGVAICGWTGSFGTDAGSGSYHDEYVVKLDVLGNVVWSLTFGNAAQIDRAYDIVELNDSSLAVSGSYLHGGYFHASLAKVSSSGSLTWLKVYGETNHSTHGFAVGKTANGDILLGGSTTVLENNWQDYADNLVIRTDANGDTLWVKVFQANNPDSFENVASVLETSSGKIGVMVATSGYPSIGFVPNKHALYELSSSGNLIGARVYNRGGSHYPRLHHALDNGFVITGFSNWTGYGLNGNTWSAVLIKTDSTYNAGCGEMDVINMTTQFRPGMDVAVPVYTEMSGSTIINSGNALSETVTDTVICETFSPIIASFTQDTTQGCEPLLVQFTNQSTGPANFYLWDFGDGTFDSTYSPSHQFPDSGTFIVTLFAIDTLCKDTSVYSQVIIVFHSPVASFIYDPSIDIQVGMDIQFTDQSTGSLMTWTWTFGDGDSAWIQNPVHSYSDPGTYQVGLYVVDSNGCHDYYSVSVTVEDDVMIPNVFSPNGDGINDLLEFKGMRECEVFIFDRWGNKIFYNGGNTNEFWNGKTAAGSDCPVGVYFARIIGFTFKGERVNEVQNITLVR